MLFKVISFSALLVTHALPSGRTVSVTIKRLRFCPC